MRLKTKLFNCWLSIVAMLVAFVAGFGAFVGIGVAATNWLCDHYGMIAGLGFMGTVMLVAVSFVFLYIEIKMP